jgi:aspartate/methionine/tyrosine aminotransferase
MSSIEFTEKFLDKARVAVGPDNTFSELGKGFIRISCASPMTKLQGAMGLWGIL